MGALCKKAWRSPRQWAWVLGGPNAVVEVCRWLFMLLDWVVPKKKNLVIFASSNGRYWEGNSRAAYEFARAEEPDIEAYFYQRARRPGSDDHRLGGLSLRVTWRMLRARTFVCTHGLGDFFVYRPSRRKLLVQLWHGVPLKAMGVLDRGRDRRRDPVEVRGFDRYDVVLAPSRLAGHFLSVCVRLDGRKLFYAGQPRNDAMVLGRRSGPSIRELLPSAPDFERVILYCPTYRRSVETRFFPFEDFDDARLGEFLEKRKALLLVRGHVDEIADVRRWRSARTIAFGQDICPDMNTILLDVDVLVTDYASAYIDFLLLDRPVVFVPYDLEEYCQDPGLLVHDYDFWTPGPKALTFEQFLGALEGAFGEPGKDAQRRHMISHLLNRFEDGRGSAKVLEMIKERVGLVPTAAPAGPAGGIE